MVTHEALKHKTVSHIYEFMKVIEDQAVTYRKTLISSLRIEPVILWDEVAVITQSHIQTK